MASSDEVEELFEEVDKNRDGKIDKRELRNWISKNEEATSSSYRTRDNSASRYNYSESMETISNLSRSDVINTSSSEETKRYLERSSINVYIDPNPKIIRRATTERPITVEQRVLVRCLQPPPLPEPEPLIIKEVRQEQPPLPPPLVIREQTSHVVSPPPIVLRERPPTPPSRISGETSTRVLPPLPLPPRSLVIERFPRAPEKLPDIIIERWCPYGAASERRTIVQRAPSPIKYPAPTHTVIEYDNAPTNVVRKFERLGVTEEDPKAYIARYGTSLLDPETLVHQARKVGVTEDISCPYRSSSTGVIVRGGSSQGFSSSGERTYERIQRIADTEGTNRGYSSYSTSSYSVGNTALVGGVQETRSEYHASDADSAGGNTKRDGKLNQSDYYRSF